jgi:hypothetical protein
MEQKTKDAIFHDMMRKFAEGGKGITAEAFRDFVEAQNDDLRTGPKIGQKIPDFTLLESARQKLDSGQADGTKRAIAGFQPQRRLVTLLPQSARRAATHPWSTESARNQRGVDHLRLARSSQ